MTFVAVVIPLVIQGLAEWSMIEQSFRCHTDPQAVPFTLTALVLGTSPTVSGHPNGYYSARIAAAAQLYHAGRIRYLLLSGDHGTAEYDEPSAMARDLVQLGVPEDRLYRDHAGFRTLDSVVRASAVFGQSQLIIISQQDHAERAVYLARSHGVEAEAFIARKPSGAPWWMWWRERLARSGAWLDSQILDRQPRYFGSPVRIGIDPDDPG